MDSFARWLGAALAAFATLAPGAAHAEFGVAVTTGARKMSDPSWQALESQWLLGAVGYWGRDDSPLRLSLGAMGSFSTDGEDGPQRSVDVTDLNLGVRLMRPRGRVRPYIEAGVSRIEAEYEESVYICSWFAPFDCTERTVASAEDSSTGAWVGTGLAFRSAHGFQLGLDLRWLGGTDLTLLERATNADGLTGQLVVGWTTAVPQPRGRRRTIKVPPSTTRTNGDRNVPARPHPSQGGEQP